MTLTEEFKKAAFSSKTGKWNTPDALIADLATVFNWDIDVCASGPNVCAAYFDENHDGLSQGWSGLCWMNPPYGRQIGKWMHKALTSATNNKAATVCLIPARTDTRWWQASAPFSSQVVFIKGRLKFGNAPNSAPFPSAFMVFGTINLKQREKLFDYGWGIAFGATLNANRTDTFRMEIHDPMQ